MEAQENKFQISQNEILHMEFYLCFLNACEIRNLFSQAFIKKWSLVLLQISNYIYSPWKNVIWFKLFWYRYLSTENENYWWILS